MLVGLEHAFGNGLQRFTPEVERGLNFDPTLRPDPVTYPDLVFERSEIQYIACSSKLFQYGSLIDSTTNSERQHATYKVTTDKKLNRSM